MSTRYKIKNQFGLNFITITVVNWVDIFIRKAYKDIIVDSLRYCQREKGLVVYAYVIMSSHVHLVVKANGQIPLVDILRDFKKFTAKKILAEIKEGKNKEYESRREWLLHRFRYRARTAPGNRQHQFWQSDNHPIFLVSTPVIAQKVDYIHNNPVVEGWVDQPEHFIYSSASNYVYGKGILEVEVMDLPVSWIGYIKGG